MKLHTAMSAEIDARGEHCSANRETPCTFSEIVRAWKTECAPTREQEKLLWEWCAASRRVYNWAVAARRENFAAIDAAKREGKEPPKRISRFDQGKALTALIHDGDELGIKHTPSAIREFAVQDADLAFQAFFRKLKARQCTMKKGAKRALAKEFGAPENWPKLDGSELWSKLTGWPRFKSYRDSHHAFRTRKTIRSFGDSIKIPRMDIPLRLKERGYFPELDHDDVNTVTITWSAGKWFLSMNADWMLEIPTEPSPGSCVIDFDLPGKCRISAAGKEYVRDYPRPTAGELSRAVDGAIDVPATDPLYAELKRVRRMSRKLSRRQYNMETKEESNRRARARLELHKLHDKIARRREHAIHNMSTDIARRYGEIHVRRPDLKGEIEGKKNGEGLPYADAAWGEFLRQLKYKTAWAGGTYTEQAGDSR